MKEELLGIGEYRLDSSTVRLPELSKEGRHLLQDEGTDAGYGAQRKFREKAKGWMNNVMSNMK